MMARRKNCEPTDSLWFSALNEQKGISINCITYRYGII